MTSKDMSRDGEGDTEKRHFSAYREKRGREAAIASQTESPGALEEAVNSQYQQPQQGFIPQSRPMSISILYIATHGNNGVILRPKKKDPTIYSLLIKLNKKEVYYIINKKMPKGTRRDPIRTTNFQYLYKDPWVSGNKYIEDLLQSIEQTINEHRPNIEKHLGTTISTN